MVEVKIPPDLWEDDSEGVLTEWLCDDGAPVKEGDIIAEVMTEKVQHEVTAPVGGTLRTRVQIDDVVMKGSVIAIIEVG
ncbi:MAG: lipoyl domain-containing protein [Myxococcota bacterium]